MSRQNEELLLAYIKEHQEQFYRLAYSYAKNSEDALDIVQDAVVKAIEKQHTLRNPATIRTWFYRILVNTSIDAIRRRGKVLYTDVLPEGGSEISQESRVLDEVSLYEAIGRLSPEVRTVILLRFFEDMKIGEIADVTRLPLSTVKNRLYRGLAALRLDQGAGA